MDKAQVRPVSEKTKMTKVELAWADEFQEILPQALPYVFMDFCEFEPVMFRIADRLNYTPDFMHITEDGYIVFVEVKASKFQKGYQYSVSRMKACAQKFPMFYWVIVVRGKRSDGGWEARIVAE